MRTHRPTTRAALAALLALAIAGAAPSAARAWTAPLPQVRTLDNGLTVAVFTDRRLPVAQLQLLVPAGSDQEGPHEAGAAHLLAGSLTLGTSTRGRDGFANEAAAIGGRFAASSGREYATLGGSFLSSGLGDALELVAEAAREPALLEEEVEPVRDRILGALVRQRNDGAALADAHLPAFALAGRGLGHPETGVIPTMERLSTAQLREFHRRCWRPDRALLAIAGDVDAATAFRLVEEHFGTWAGRAPQPATVAVTAGERLRIRIVDMRTRGTADLRLAVPGPGRGHADAAALAALGRWVEGGASPLSRTRAIGGVRSGLLLFREGGLVTIGGTAMLDSAAAMTRLLRTTLRTLPEAARDEASLRALRANLEGGALVALDSPGGWIAQWISHRFYGRSDAEYARSASRWDDLGAAALRGVAERWLRGSGGWLVAVGPAERLRPLLEPLGTVEVVAAGDPAIALPKLPSEVTAEPTARELDEGRRLVTAALNAHGGRAALEQVKDVSLEGNLQVVFEGEEQIGTFRELRLEPGRFLRITVLKNAPAQQVIDGATGWIQASALGDSVLDVTGADLDEMRRDAESDFRSLLLACSDPRTRVAARGRETFGTVETEILEAVHPERGRHLVVLDAKDHRVLAIDETRTQEGSSLALRHRYGDWRKVGAILWPFYEDRSVQGERVLVMQVSSARFNTGVPANTFARPAAPRRRLGG